MKTEIEFLKSLKSSLNAGRPFNDIKTLINQRIIKVRESEQCNIANVVGRSEQCCSNPKHKTEVNELFENWVECKNCGKEII